MATIAAVPATLAALAAYHKGKQTAEQVTPPTDRDQRPPTTAEMIEQIYSRFGALEGFVRGQAADPDAHEWKKNRRNRKRSCPKRVLIGGAVTGARGRARRPTCFRIVEGPRPAPRQDRPMRPS